jgi:putative PIG3 family NAD(P)H quinone oxidoreductase
MYANCIREGELAWSQRPDPTPKDRQVLIEVRAAGVNAADVLQLRGNYPAPPGSPDDIPGMELAGVVQAVGSEVRRFSAGDRVMALVGGGAHAQLAVADEGTVLPMPDQLEFTAAAGFPEVFTTAWDAMFDQGGLKPGERVLVTGAAGGVGTAAIQLAAAAGASVVASCRNQDLLADLIAMGAEEAHLPDAALERGPFDLVLELVGGDGVGAALARLSTRGRISVIGLGAGRSTQLDLSLLMGKRARIFGSTLRARPAAEKEMVMAGVQRHVVPLLGAGRLRVPVAATYPLHQAGDAYRRLSAGGKLGKIILIA